MMFYSIKNETDLSKDLFIYGDIVSENSPDWLTGEVSETAVDLAAFKQAVDSMSGGQTLNIYINSAGGSVFAAATMVSMLQRAQSSGVKVNCYIDGLAASAASLFPMAADETHIYKNSMLMIHMPMAGMMGYYNSKELGKIIDQLDAIEAGVLMSLYDSKSKLSHQQMKNLVDAETWLDSTAIMNTFDGFILEDEVKDVAACASDYFSKYLNTPKAFIKSKPQKQIPDYSEFENKLKILDERKTK